MENPGGYSFIWILQKESSVSSDKVTKLLEASSARLRDREKERFVRCLHLFVHVFVSFQVTTVFSTLQPYASQI